MELGQGVLMLVGDGLRSEAPVGRVKDGMQVRQTGERPEKKSRQQEY